MVHPDVSTLVLPTSPVRQSIYPRATRPNAVSQHIRAIFDQPREDKDREQFYHDMRNVATFMRSQQMHKVCGDVLSEYCAGQDSSLILSRPFWNAIIHCSVCP